MTLDLGSITWTYEGKGLLQNGFQWLWSLIRVTFHHGFHCYRASKQWGIVQCLGTLTPNWVTHAHALSHIYLRCTPCSKMTLCCWWDIKIQQLANICLQPSNSWKMSPQSVARRRGHSRSILVDSLYPEVDRIYFYLHYLFIFIFSLWHIDLGDVLFVASILEGKAGIFLLQLFTRRALQKFHFIITSHILWPCVLPFSSFE